MEDPAAMKTNVIPNQYDGPRKPEKRLSSGPVSLDYVNSDDAAEIDLGIRETIAGEAVGDWHKILVNQK
jgi:hypothetical protein